MENYDNTIEVIKVIQLKNKKTCDKFQGGMDDGISTSFNSSVYPHFVSNIV